MTYPHTGRARFTGPKGFRWRGVGEMSRIEAFSDVVFGFALTLLVVSLEVPKTFDELAHAMRGFLAFAITFSALFYVWFAHYTFRRYDLRDNFTVWINGLLLFVVLFYVYPLKFLFTFVVSMVMDGSAHAILHDGQVVPMVQVHDVPALMAIYGIGFAAVSFILLLLYWHAYRRRKELDLNEVELFDTWSSIHEYAVMTIVPLVSIAIALLAPGRFFAWSYIVYWLIGPIQMVKGFIRGARRRKFEDRAAATAAAVG
jgi:uncharacterized membrane protein